MVVPTHRLGSARQEVQGPVAQGSVESQTNGVDLFLMNSILPFVVRVGRVRVTR